MKDPAVNLPQGSNKKRNELKANIGSNLRQCSKKPDKAKSVVANLPQAIAKKAKVKQIRKSVSQKSVEQKPIDTQKELAKIAGMSHDTIHRVEVIELSSNTKLRLT